MACQVSSATAQAPQQTPPVRRDKKCKRSALKVPCVLEGKQGPPCSSGQQTQVESNAKQGLIPTVGCIALQSECSPAGWSESVGLMACVCSLHGLALFLNPRYALCAAQMLQSGVLCRIWALLQASLRALPAVSPGLCMPGLFHARRGAGRVELLPARPGDHHAHLHMHSCGRCHLQESGSATVTD